MCTQKDPGLQDKQRELVSLIACNHIFARPKLRWQIAGVSREFPAITWAFHGHGEGYEEVCEPNEEVTDEVTNEEVCEPNALGPVGVEDSENVLNHQSCRTPGDMVKALLETHSSSSKFA